MTFTNTTSAEYYICWQVKVKANEQVYDQFDYQVSWKVDDQVSWKVDDQVSWKVYGQIYPILYKIKQEINK